MNKTNETLEKIKEKIAKLLRKSESANAVKSFEEATAFANKANELLIQYNIKLADINRDAGLPVEPDVVIMKTPLSSFGNVESRDGTENMITLINIVHKYNLCKVILSTEEFMGNHKDPILYTFGTEENLKNVAILAVQMVAVSINLCVKNWKEYDGPIKRGKFRRDFLYGFNRGFNSKLKEHEEKQNTQTFALMRTNEVAITDKVYEVFKEGTTSKPTKVKEYNDALIRGFKAGNELELNKNIG